MRIIIIILLSILLKPVYSQGGLSEKTTIIVGITDCYSDSLEDVDIPMRIDYFHDYNFKVYNDGVLIESIIADSRYSINKLCDLEFDDCRIIISPILSEEILFDTIVEIKDGKVRFDKCVGDILSEKKLNSPKLEAQNDIVNGMVQVKWLLRDSSQELSLKRMNKISEKYDFRVICVGSHWTQESVQYLNSYNTEVFLYLNKKFGKITIDKVGKKLMRYNK